MSRPWPGSFRLRLTLWYGGLFSLLFLVFSLFLHALVYRALVSRLDSRLVSEAATAAGLFEDELEELKGDIPRAASEAATEMRLAGSIVAILSGRRVLAESQPGAPTAVLQEFAGAGQSGVVVSFRAHAAVHRLSTASGNFAILSYSTLDAIDSDLAILRHALLIGFPLVLLLAGAGGYAIATRGLAPLASMAGQARAITGRSLDRRIQIADAADEIAVLAASFNDLLGRLDQSFESMRRFVADASHELRTPLSVIRGEADVALVRQRTPAEYRASLAVILDESRHLSRLVEDLLNLARADSGRFELHPEDFYFNDLLAECCRSLQSLASQRGVQLECHCPGDIPFRGDQQLLRRLVLNLIDNAIRYTPSGGRVSGSVQLQAEGVCLRVTDTGIGIPPESAPHVFERFYRADKSRSRENGGFGLGLSIVQWIAESHHGTVALDSRPETGTTFTVTLPR